MKKTILLAIVALSMNAFAQNKPASTNHMKHKEDKTQLLNRIKPGSNNISSIKESRKMPSFLLQKPDSIREWSWDINTSDWINDSKTVDMIYDTNNNLTSQREMIWNETFWENAFKTEMHYDGYRPISTFTQKWTDNNWENYMLSSTFYNANNQLDSTKTELWVGGDWTKTNINIFLYDLSNRLVTLQIEIHFGAFTSKTKVTYSYDANNNRVTEYNQTWAANDWVNSNWIDYTYDAQNNVKSEIEKTWLNNEWKESKKQTYDYDSQGNTLNETYFTWTGSTWMYSRQYVSTYNPQNLQTSELYQTYNGATWVDGWKYTMEYEGNNLKYETYQEGNGGTLVNVRKTSYNYIGQDFVSEELNQTWNGATWINESQLLSIYDGNYNLLKEMDQNWNGTAWIDSRTSINTYSVNNILKSESDRYWDIDGITVTSGDSTHYYFSETSVGSSETKDDKISLYPNPNAGKFKIMSPNNIIRIEISNLLGEMVLSNFRINKNNPEIDLSEYAKGIYVVKIKTANETIIRKIIVR